MLTRRRRLVVRTLVFSGLLLAVVVVAVLWDGSEPYRPGEDLEGLTDTLTRDIPEGYAPVIWRDVAASSGIAFRHFSGTRSIQLPEDMGSGAAWGDFDGDGWVDLYLANVAGPLSTDTAAGDGARGALYRNVNGARFDDVTVSAGLGDPGWEHAAVWADYDGDGRLDLTVTGYGRLRLYRNEGAGRFAPDTTSGIGDREGFWTGASWADYDRDGDLDLYVCGYVQYVRLEPGRSQAQYETLSPASINPSSFRPERNLLFRNEDGRFEEVGEASGVLNAEGRSLSAVWWDFDNDGWLDLYVANDVSDNVLYHNRRDGTFEDVSLRTFVADYRGAMGLATGDADSDGDLDLFVTHWIAQENAYYENLFADLREAGVPGEEALRFADNAERLGLGQIALDYVGWGTGFLDFDLDGRLDLVVANGHTLGEPDRPTRLIPMRTQLFWNSGRERGFYDVAEISGDAFRQERVGRGLAVADYDNDGDPDVAIVAHGEPCALLRNDQTTGHGWLKVRLRGSGRNRFAVGARVTVVADGRRQMRELRAGGSYCSQHAAGEVLFGLGGTSTVDSVIVRWPRGGDQVLTDVGANRTVTVEEPGR